MNALSPGKKVFFDNPSYTPKSASPAAMFDGSVTAIAPGPGEIRSLLSSLDTELTRQHELMGAVEGEFMPVLRHPTPACPPSEQPPVVSELGTLLQGLLARLERHNQTLIHWRENCAL